MKYNLKISKEHMRELTIGLIVSASLATVAAIINKHIEDKRLNDDHALAHQTSTCYNDFNQKIIASPNIQDSNIDESIFFLERCLDDDYLYETVHKRTEIPFEPTVENKDFLQSLTICFKNASSELQRYFHIEVEDRWYFDYSDQERFERGLEIMDQYRREAWAKLSEADKREIMNGIQPKLEICNSKLEQHPFFSPAR